MVAYVNTSVTDASRAYWDTSWVTPTNPSEPDVGVVNPNAPAWLRNNLGGVDFDPAHPGDEAIRVDYRDPAWRAMVVAQAVTQVQAGYGGVFLDDVGQYYQAGFHGGSYDPTLADSMMQLVIDVAAAIRAVDPAAKVIVNSGVFIGGDSSGGTAGALFAAYKAAIDGMIIENQFHTEAQGPGVLSAALANFPAASIMALESAALGLNREAFLDFAGRTGVLPSVVPNEGYNSFTRAPLLGTAAANVLEGAFGFANLIGGLGGNDRVSGAGLSDTIYGHSGDDSIMGNGGSDVIGGGTGRDWLYGALGNDSISGGADGDRLYGGAGNDAMNGNAGNDMLHGGAGDDRLFGASGADVFQFDYSIGRDQIMDFTQGQDRINLHAFAPSLTAVTAALHLETGGIRLDLSALGGHGSVLIVGQTNLADFTAADFIL